jgi:hypothetical protein
LRAPLVLRPACPRSRRCPSRRPTLREATAQSGEADVGDDDDDDNDDGDDDDDDDETIRLAAQLENHMMKVLLDMAARDPDEFAKYCASKNIYLLFAPQHITSPVRLARADARS